MYLTCLFLLLLHSKCKCQNPILVKPQPGMHPRVIAGWEADRGVVPYQVSFKTRTLMYNHGGYYSNFCGGSIITPEKVVSAAHCFVEEMNICARIVGWKSSINRLNRYIAVAGNINTGGVMPLHDSVDDGQWRAILDVKFPDTYKFPMDDIALVYLRSPFIFNANIGAIPIASPRFVDYTGICTTSGFGRISKRMAIGSSRLLVGNVRLLSHRQCSKRQRLRTNNLICVVASPSDCGQGDSGGPLVCKDTGDPNEGNSGVLVGVVSGGTDHGSIYTRVSAFSEYIQRGKSRPVQGNVHVIFIVLFIRVF